MRSELHPSYSRIKEQTLRWIEENGFTRKYVAKKLGISEPELSRFLSYKHPSFKPTLERLRPRMNQILAGLTQMCETSYLDSLPIHRKQKAQLESKFGLVEFFPLRDDSVDVLGQFSANVVSREVGRIVMESRKSEYTVLLSAGGDLMRGCARRLRFVPAGYWPEVRLGGMNEAEWRDDRKERSANRSIRDLSESLGCPLLSHRDLVQKAGYQPGVFKTSVGNRYGFACERAGVKGLPKDVVGDFNYHLLFRDGREYNPPKIRAALAPLRYFHSLDELHGCLQNKRVILAVTDTPLEDPRYKPPASATKVPVVCACLKAGLVHTVILPEAMGRKLLDAEPLEQQLRN